DGERRKWSLCRQGDDLARAGIVPVFKRNNGKRQAPGTVVRREGDDFFGKLARAIDVACRRREKEREAEKLRIYRICSRAGAIIFRRVLEIVLAGSKSRREIVSEFSGLRILRRRRSLQTIGRARSENRGDSEGNGNQCNAQRVLLHIRIVRTAATFRRGPFDVLLRVLDVASFAVNTVLRVDLKAWTFGLLHDFVDAGRAIALGRFIVTRKVYPDRD